MPGPVESSTKHSPNMDAKDGYHGTVWCIEMINWLVSWRIRESIKMKMTTKHLPIPNVRPVNLQLGHAFPHQILCPFILSPSNYPHDVLVHKKIDNSIHLLHLQPFKAIIHWIVQHTTFCQSTGGQGSNNLPGSWVSLTVTLIWISVP